MKQTIDPVKDPGGAPVSAAFGGVLGGVAGKSAAKSIDAARENTYWARQFKSEPYVERNLKYADYEPAYRFGWESYQRYEGRDFLDLYSELQRDWDAHRADSPLTWEKAKAASQAAWRRVENGQDLPLDPHPNAPRASPQGLRNQLDHGSGRR
ncbi:MAG: hypothetical protein ABI672_04575 [Vicinamibacteria bacterium]